MNEGQSNTGMCVAIAKGVILVAPDHPPQASASFSAQLEAHTNVKLQSN